MRPPPEAAGPGRLGRWWLDRSVRVKGMVVVTVPLIALIGVTSASLALQYKERQVRSVAITASALNTAAQQVLSDAVNAETGARGYAATREPVFLQPYDVIVARVTRDRAALRAAAATMAQVMAGLARLRSAVSAGAPPAALTATLVSEKRAMDTL